MSMFKRRSSPNGDGQVTVTEASQPPEAEPVAGDLTEAQRGWVDVMAQLGAQAHARREAALQDAYAREAAAKRDREQAAKDAAAYEARAIAEFTRDLKRSLAAQREAAERDARGEDPWT